MAYWINDTVDVGGSRQLQYFMDTDTDLGDLPTTSAEGVQQDEDTTIHLTCGKGSIALAISTGNLYVLDSSDEWIGPINTPGQGSGGGSSNGGKFVIELSTSGIAASVDKTFEEIVSAYEEGKELIVNSSYLNLKRIFHLSGLDLFDDNIYTFVFSSCIAQGNTSSITTVYINEDGTVDILEKGGSDEK